MDEKIFNKLVSVNYSDHTYDDLGVIGVIVKENRSYNFKIGMYGFDNHYKMFGNSNRYDNQSYIYVGNSYISVNCSQKYSSYDELRQDFINRVAKEFNIMDDFILK